MPMENFHPLHAVILDMDGIIIDSETIYRIAWQAAASELGYVLSADSYSSLLGFTIQDAEAELSRRFGPDFSVPCFHRLWMRRWTQIVETHGMPVKPGLWDFLDVTEACHLPVAVATSSDSKIVEFSLRAAGLDGRFTCIVSGDQVSNGKPAPDLFLEAARRLAVLPQTCIVFEDSEAGLQAAKAAGIPAIMIPDLKPPSPQAKAMAFRILPSLHEAADFIKEYARGQPLNKKIHSAKR